MSTLHSIRHVVGACAAAVAALLLSASAPHAAPAGWERLEHDALRGGGHIVYINDILAADGAGNPWLAVGYVVDSDGNRDPSAWTSMDGVTWRRFSMESTGSSDQRDGPFAVARRGNVSVAVGNRFDGQLRPAAWTSTTPNTWRALKAESDPLLAFRGLIEGLHAGPDGFVAVGYQHHASGTTINVFRSEDGQAWSLDSAFSPPPGELFQPLHVSATHDRTVIVGDTAAAPGPDGRIWVGTNGSWSSVDPVAVGLDGAGWQQVAGVAWDPTLGFVAGGMTVRQNVEFPTLWHSPDGVAWQRLQPLEGGAAAAVHDVIATPGGFLASGNSDSGPRVWRSANGRDWSAVATPSSPGEGGVSVSIASDGAKMVFVATGQRGSRILQRRGTEWKRGDTGPAFPASAPFAAELRDVTAAGGRLVAVGADGNGKPLVLFSPRAGVWRKAPFTDRAARLLAVSSDRAGFSIAGWRMVQGRARLAIWTSRSGMAWRRLGGTRDEPIGAFVDVTRDSSGLLAAVIEGSQRGLKVSAWNRAQGIWRSTPILGSGEAQAVCVGPHGATIVATAGVGSRKRVLTWSRASNGQWSSEPELVAAGVLAQGCADGPKGTVIAGADENGFAVVWRRARPGQPWTASPLAVTGPPTTVNDVVRDGSGYLATGTTGGRGQSDLAIWKSSDGVQWNRIGGIAPVFVEAGFQSGLGIARTRGKIVVVGRHGAGNAGLWVGAP